MDLLIKLGMVIIGTCFYVKGETSESPLGKSNKIWKYIMGFPIGLLSLMLTPFNFVNIACILTYFLATWGFGYGEDNFITKLIGKTAAITLCGFMLGLASFPLLSYWAILAGISSGLGFWVIYQFDTEGKIIEPWIALARGLVGLMFLLGV